MRYDLREKLAGYFDLLFLFIQIDIFIWLLFELGLPYRPIVYTVGRVVSAVFILELIVKFLLSSTPRSFITQYWTLFIVLGILIYALVRFQHVDPGNRFLFVYSRGFLSLVEVLIFVKFIVQTERLFAIVGSFRVSPAKLIIVSFATIILFGSFLLYLPYARPKGEGMRYIDAVFTATSAVCVTGLVVVDTGTAFSRVGHFFILLLIQMGGLGIMTIAAFIQVSLGSQMSVHGRFSTASLLDQGDMRNLFGIIRAIVLTTFAFEAVGVGLFAPFFLKTVDRPPTALFYALFHAISAFCNAGFSLYRDSFVHWRGSLWPNTVLILLIVLGGLGFTVLRNLGRRIVIGEKERIAVQTRIVLVMSSILVVFGALVVYLFERNDLFAGYAPHEKFLASIFQSVTARTAGFNTVETAALRPVTLLFTSALMFIGASPGSTGGGIKTTTFFILVLSIVTILRDQRFNTVFRRRIPFMVVNRAFAIFVSALVLVVAGTLVLGYTEDFSIVRIFFEVVSAFGTVGLSTGITPHLSDFGKIVIIFLMFTGRIGPLTLVLAVRNAQATKMVTYPEERVMVG
jgi:trk system potassium uptake protein TrkH